MKKAKDELRSEYKRSDFARLERGKLYAEVVKGTAVALLDPLIAEAFPTSKAVNDALHGLLTLTEQTSRITMWSTGGRVRRGALRVSVRGRLRLPQPFGIDDDPVMSDVGVIVLSGLNVSGLFVRSLAAVNVISQVRRLGAKGAPRPWFVIFRKIRGALPTYRTRSTHGLENRIAWLSRDLRWVTAGETVARITQAVPETQELCLELAQPISLAGTHQLPPIHMETVRFVPRYARTAAYDRAAVQGTLRPVLDEGLMATAEIVVYSDQASAR